MDTKVFEEKFNQLKESDADFAAVLDKQIAKAGAYDEAVTAKEAAEAELKSKSDELEKVSAENEENLSELRDLKASDSSKEVKNLKKIIDEQQAEIEKLKKANESNPNKDRLVEGQYESKKGGKGKGKIFTFKDGFVKTRLSSGEIIDSKDALDDADIMEWLIEIGYGGLEIVE